jgi:hypothetical protein
VNPKRQETNEEVLPNSPSRSGRDANADEAVGDEADVGSMADAVLEVDPHLSMQPRKREQDTCGDEVIPGFVLALAYARMTWYFVCSPRRQSMVAVEEEEEHKHERCYEMREFEPLIAHRPVRELVLGSLPSDYRFPLTEVVTEKRMSDTLGQ